MVTTLNLTFLAQTDQARLYQNSTGIQKWIPSSICPKIFKHGNDCGNIHEVTIEDWWLAENPWIKPESEGQQTLL